jgi:NADPH:quinone reductase-like Zn-dependent oxidoreductase
MRAIEIARQGSPVAANVALATTRPAPEPAAGRVLVRTLASALNHLDLWVGRGLPGIETAWPMVGGSDGVGVVERAGPGVDGAWVGRRVALNAAIMRPEPARPGRAPAGEDVWMIGEHEPGTHAEYFTAPAENVLDIGDADPVLAAAFGLTHLTAWRMMVTRGGLHPGMTVLIPGIGGGVALAALGIARHFGCTIVVTSRSAAKLERARAAGAHHAILDEGADWSRAVRQATGGRGVDLVVESVGRAVHMACIKAMARGGTLVTCGCTTGADPQTDLARIFWNQLSIRGSTMGTMAEFRDVMALFATGALAPVVDTVFAPSDARAAYARLEAGEQFGKLVFDWRRG